MTTNDNDFDGTDWPPKPDLRDPKARMAHATAAQPRKTKQRKLRPGDPDRPLTAKQQAFVDAYLGTAQFNAKQAAIMAGYSEATAREEGYKLLCLPHVAKAVQIAMAERAADAKIDKDWVLKNAVKLFNRATQQTIRRAVNRHGDELFMEPDGSTNTEGQGEPLFTYDSAMAAKMLDTVSKHTDVQAYAPDKVEVTGSGMSIEAIMLAARERSRKIIDITPDEIEPLALPAPTEDEEDGTAEVHES